MEKNDEEENGPSSPTLHTLKTLERTWTCSSNESVQQWVDSLNEVNWHELADVESNTLPESSNHVYTDYNFLPLPGATDDELMLGADAKSLSCDGSERGFSISPRLSPLLVDDTSEQIISSQSVGNENEEQQTTITGQVEVENRGSDEKVSVAKIEDDVRESEKDFRKERMLNNRQESITSFTSLSTLLAAMETDPEDMLISLGFGNEFSSPLQRIPSRFLMNPSQAKGIDVQEFCSQFMDIHEKEISPWQDTTRVGLAKRFSQSSIDLSQVDYEDNFFAKMRRAKFKQSSIPSITIIDDDINEDANSNKDSVTRNSGNLRLSTVIEEHEPSSRKSSLSRSFSKESRLQKQKSFDASIAGNDSVFESMDSETKGVHDKKCDVPKQESDFKIEKVNLSADIGFLKQYRDLDPDCNARIGYCEGQIEKIGEPCWEGGPSGDLNVAVDSKLPSLIANDCIILKAAGGSEINGISQHEYFQGGLPESDLDGDDESPVIKIGCQTQGRELEQKIDEKEELSDERMEKINKVGECSQNLLGVDILKKIKEFELENKMDNAFRKEELESPLKTENHEHSRKENVLTEASCKTDSCLDKNNNKAEVSLSSSNFPKMVENQEKNFEAMENGYDCDRGHCEYSLEKVEDNFLDCSGFYQQVKQGDSDAQNSGNVKSELFSKENLEFDQHSKSRSISECSYPDSIENSFDPNFACKETKVDLETQDCKFSNSNHKEAKIDLETQGRQFSVDSLDLDSAFPNVIKEEGNCIEDSEYKPCTPPTNAPTSPSRIVYRSRGKIENLNRVANDDCNDTERCNETDGKHRRSFAESLKLSGEAIIDNILFIGRKRDSSGASLDELSHDLKSSVGTESEKSSPSLGESSNKKSSTRLRNYLRKLAGGNIKSFLSLQNLSTPDLSDKRKSKSQEDLLEVKRNSCVSSSFTNGFEKDQKEKRNADFLTDKNRSPRKPHSRKLEKYRRASERMWRPYKDESVQVNSNLEADKLEERLYNGRNFDDNASFHRPPESRIEDENDSYEPFNEERVDKIRAKQLTKGFSIESSGFEDEADLYKSSPERLSLDAGKKHLCVDCLQKRINQTILETSTDSHAGSCDTKPSSESLPAVGDIEGNGPRNSTPATSPASLLDMKNSEVVLGHIAALRREVNEQEERIKMYIDESMERIKSSVLTEISLLNASFKTRSSDSSFNVEFQ